MKRKTRLVGCLAMLATACGGGETGPTPVPSSATTPRGEVLSQLPDAPDPDRRFLIYLHNLWLENRDDGAPHPDFGVYDFDGILSALAGPGVTVIGEVRPRGTDPHAAAQRVADQVATLLASGVAPEHVTVAGFSKGGAIAILASAAIADDSVNFVFLAACGSWLESTPALVPRGRMLSIRESSDEVVGSCERLFDRAPPSAEHEEVVLSLGGGHGAFFRPHPAWIRPVTRWAAGAGPS